jgi:hypothetical protein
MDFFSGKNPDLIGPTMKLTLNDIMNRPKVNNSTISEKIMLSLSDFYNDYISDNMFSIICIIILIICLVYRYYNKKEDKLNTEPFVISKQKDTNLLEELKNYDFEEAEYDAKHIAGDNPYDGHLYMNPIESIDKQANKTQVVYPPDKMPVNMVNGKVFVRNLYDNPVEDEPLNAPDYDYNNVYKNKSRSYYSGAYNTYENAVDTKIINPYDWSNKFNTTSGKFVGEMTNKNSQNLINYQTIIDNTDSNLINGSNGNIKFMPEFEKPYEE